MLSARDATGRGLTSRREKEAAAYLQPDVCLLTPQKLIRGGKYCFVMYTDRDPRRMYKNESIKSSIYLEAAEEEEG